MGLSALSHQMVNFCCEWVWWKEDSVLHKHHLNYLIAKGVPGKGEGLEGKAFTKAGEMRDGSIAWGIGLTLVNKCFFNVDSLLGLLCWSKMCCRGLMDHELIKEWCTQSLTWCLCYSSHIWWPSTVVSVALEKRKEKLYVFLIVE